MNGDDDLDDWGDDSESVALDPVGEGISRCWALCLVNISDIEGSTGCYFKT